VDLVQALILGFIQGVTEFFPISSSAHLKLAKLFFGIDAEKDIFFDLICHLGTLFACILYLRKEIQKVFRDRKRFFLIFLAIIPLVPFYFFLKPVRVYFSQIQFLGFFLIFTGLLLFLLSKRSHQEAFVNISSQPFRRKINDVLFIGCMQTLALIPGISRAGSTITAACFRGWHWREAVCFSFLLAIPTILGGSLLEVMKAVSSTGLVFGEAAKCYLVGFVSSFAVGLISVRLLFWSFEKKKIRPFAWYCLILGLLTAIYLNFFYVQ